MAKIDYDKFIISLLKYSGIGLDIRNALAEQGLEVKGEEIVKKTTESKFNVGDWLVSISFGDVVQIESFDEEYNYVWFTNGTGTNYKALCDYEHWTIDDANDGDVLVTCNNIPFLYTGTSTNRDGDEWIGAYGFVSLYGVFRTPTFKDTFTKTENVHPATKEQRELLFKKMKEAGYVWDENEKTLKKAEADETWIPQKGDIFKKKDTYEPLYHLTLQVDEWSFNFVEERYNGAAGGTISISVLKDEYELVKRPKKFEEIMKEVQKQLEKDMKTPEESLDIKTDEEAEAYKNAINDCLFGDEIQNG